MRKTNRILILVLAVLILFGQAQILHSQSHAKTPDVTQTLRRGSKGTQVKYLQQKLNDLGFNVGAVDGSFGPKTLTGVRAFQKANGLAVDGVVGPATRGKLNGASSQSKPSDPKPTDPKPDNSSKGDIPKVTQTLRRGSKGTQVKYLQQRLNALGFNVGAVDGSFGPATLAGVKAFQKAYKLAVDGIVGPATRGKLNSLSTGESKPKDPKPEDSKPKDPPSSDIPKVTQTLRRGSKGTQVKYLQQRLNALGFNVGAVDGSFGPATLAGVKAFQKAYKLAVDGIVGPATRGKLNTVLPKETKPEEPKPEEPKPEEPKPEKPKPEDPKPETPPANNIAPVTQTLRKGDKGTQVKYLQEKLNALGFDVGEVDGSFGAKTLTGVLNFQAAYKLAVDGVVGPATRAALNAAVPGTEPETGGFKEFNPASGELKGKTVILDPGHGGRDSGAAWNGNLEKNFNLDMAKRLQRMLEKAGAKVLMTRTKDEYSYLYYRSSFVNKYIVDLELEDQKDQKTAAESVKADKGKELTKKKDAHILAQNLLDQYDLELSAKKAEALELSTNNNISDLRNELTKQETYRDVAKSNVEWLEARIEEINGLRDKISHLETKINGFDEEIKELEAELDKEKQEEEPDETNIGELENRIERLKSDKEYSKEKLDGKEGELDGLLAEIAGKFDEREPKAILDGLWEEIDGFEQRISVIKPIVKEYDALMDEARVLEEETVPKTKDDIAKLNGEISSLDKAISSLTTQIAAISAEITDLSSKSKALLNIINNPSLGSRTGIYKLDGKDKNGKNQINTQLKEVLDLTREKYDKNMIFVAVHCNAMGGGGTTTASGVQVYYRDSSADNGYAVNQYYYQNYNDKLRLKLAKAMLKNTRENTNFKGQWTTPFRKDFHVLREQNLPSVLMEIGFVNNPADVTLLNQEQTRENAAKGMYLGIAEYFKN